MNQIDGRRFAAADLPAGPVAVAFVADWCGYCRRFLPHFKQMREAYVVDISDEADPLWDTYDIQVVPTVILFEKGEPVRKWAGVLNEKDAATIAALAEP